MSLKTRLTVYRKIAVSMVFFMVLQLIHPAALMALTSGPAQPEFSSFEPVNTTEMVDLFTGDFTYNIPLFELPGPNGGYPFNLAYHSGAQMDTEASWAGLGWTINAGALNRQMRGLPDDFNGDEIQITESIKDNWNAGINFKPDVQVFGQSFLKHLNGSLDLYFNRYKGFGYSVGFSVAHKFGTDKFSGSLGLGLSLDSQSGANLSPSLTINTFLKDTESRFDNTLSTTASLGYNNRHGLTSMGLGFGFSSSEEVIVKDAKTGAESSYKKDGSYSASPSTLSFAYDSHTPSVDLPWSGTHARIEVDPGGFPIAFVNGRMAGYYSTQFLRHKGEAVSIPAYGYLNLENSYRNNEVNALMDFNREKDGPITKDSPNLGSVATTFDIYTSTGQGIGGQFRPYRDFGILSDREMRSTIGGGGLSVDFGPGHLGGGGDIAFSNARSGMWNEDNAFLDGNQFAGNAGGFYEPYYFKVQGEATSEDPSVIDNYIGGEKPMRIGLGGNRHQNATNQLLRKSANYLSEELVADFNSRRTERKPRNLNSIEFTNTEIQTGLIPEFDITVAGFNRAALPQHHIGGFQALTGDGIRYNYGLPAYNHLHEDYIFSVAGANNCGPSVDFPVANNDPDYEGVAQSDRYFNKKEIPEYAHTYLLTSIQGPDYVDLGTPGFDAADKGYWVEFTYAQAHENFSWRAPYGGASFSEGARIKPEDDKGSFTYGEKEIWYLERAETASHISIFNTIDRKDGHEATGRFAQTGATATTAQDALQLLDNVCIFTRDEFENNPSPVPMKKVHLEYDYSLCEGVFNNDGTPHMVDGVDVNYGGKLTLKKLWFTYENSTRGELNPYQFDYGNAANNYDYAENRVDRWGNYKVRPTGQDECYNLDFPYVQQVDHTPGADLKAVQDQYASAWNMSEIVLPSGATMNIDYERKDYAYVQNEVATKMFNASTEAPSGGDFPTYSEINDATDRVYFRLEEALPSSATATDLEPYFEDLPRHPVTDKIQLYYRIQSNVIGINNLANAGDIDFANVSGYSNIESYGLVDAGGNYEYAWIQLEDSGIDSYHPFKLATFQFLQTSLSDIAYGPLATNDDDPEGSKSAKKRKLLSLLGPFFSIFQIFSGVYGFFNIANRGKYIETAESFIKLNTPDKRKYGGGARVTRITLDDHWDTDGYGATLGQSFEYSTMLNDEEISSGVAAYEPLIGGDENALRYAKQYTSKTLPLKSPNNLFFEFPINESYYPGPTIGHSQITVKSLATKLSEEAASNLPPGISTTGQEVHEFYTAKEFPVITDETILLRPGTNGAGNLQVSKDEQNIFIPIPLVGQIKRKRIVASQGYSTILNDMHGRPRKVSSFAQDKDGNYAEQADRWVQYNYQTIERNKDGKTYLELDNQVEVMVDYDPNASGQFPVESRIMGVDYETFSSMREHSSNSDGGGLEINGEFPFPFPLPAFAINLNLSETRTRTAITNKIIHKSGIMASTEAYDGTSRIVTDNVLYDGLTGQPILTTVNNNYDDPVYNLNIPAHMVYDMAGPAYKTISSTFSGFALSGPNGYHVVEGVDGPSQDCLLKMTQGDEFLLHNPTTGFDHKATFVKMNGQSSLFDITPGTDLPTFTDPSVFKQIRSGNRNHLSAAAGNVVALADPTNTGATVTSSVTFDAPSLQSAGNQWCWVVTNREEILTQIEYFNQLLAAKDQIPSACGQPLFEMDLSNSCIIFEGPPYPVRVFRDIPGASDNVTLWNCPWVTGTRILHLNDGTVPDVLMDLTIASQFASIDEIDYVTVNPITFGPIDSNPPTIDPNTPNVQSVPANGIAYVRFYLTAGGYVDLGIEEAFICDVEGEWISTSIYNEDAMICEVQTRSASSNSVSEILSASATIYSDIWETDDNIEASTSMNPFATGKRGIWRPYESYSYVANRDQTGDNLNSYSQMNTIIQTELNLREDGTMQQVPLFDWDNPFFSLAHAEHWQLQERITKYDKEQQLETSDVLDNKSAALYGYDGFLPTAVAANASYHEIAFEGFEEPTPISLNALEGFIQANGNPTNGHFQFYNLATDHIYALPFDIRYALNRAVQVNAPFDADIFTVGDEVTVTMFPTESYNNLDVRNPQTEYYEGVILESVACGEFTNLRLDFPTCSPPFGKGMTWSGKLTVNKKVGSGDGGPMNGVDLNGVRVVNNMAHTGENSLLIPIDPTGGEFTQSILQFHDDEYFISLWAHIADITDHDFSDNLDLRIENGNGVEFPLVAASPIIEGWQLFETSFAVNNSEEVKLKYETYVDVHIDDLRIQPNNSSLQSYVYDKTNYRLQATLDENNFATFYQYQPDGSLYLIKKETERGIMTIQETISHVKENQ